MRNNSLRQESWQRKQQSLLFKKFTQLTPNPSSNPHSPPLPQSNSYAVNYQQHSEIKWLEKLVAEINQFNEQKEARVLREKTNEQIGKLADTVTTLQMPKKGEVGRQEIRPEQTKKSVRKIKFEIISNKQNAQPKAKRSLPVTSLKADKAGRNKSSQRLGHLVQPHLKPTKDQQTQSQQHRAEQQKQDRGNHQQQETKVSKQGLKDQSKRQMSALELQKMMTQIFAVEQSLEFSKNESNLWKTASKENSLLKSANKARKSIGKIVKNSLNQTLNQRSASKLHHPNNHAIHITSNPLAPSTTIPTIPTLAAPGLEEIEEIQQRQQQGITQECPTMKHRPQKIFIQLHTQNLSKYLTESGVTDANTPAQIKPATFLNGPATKYCPTKQGDHIVIRAIHTDSEPKQEHLQGSQSKKNVGSNRKPNAPYPHLRPDQAKQRNYLSCKKPKHKEPTPGQLEARRRGKSDQTKFNQSTAKPSEVQRKLSLLSKTVTANESLNEQAKAQEGQLMPSFSFKHEHSPTRRTQGRQPQPSDDLQERQKGQKARPKDYSCQKIFTLNSDRESYQEQTRLMRKQQKETQIEHRTVFFDEMTIANLDFIPKVPPNQFKTFQSPPRTQQKQESAQRQPKVTAPLSLTLAQQHQNYSPALEQLFIFLDGQNSGLLSSCNCRTECLSQQVRLLLSPILNQIKSKNKSYKLSEFVAEGQSVLGVKQEVYDSNTAHPRRPKIANILRQNIEALMGRNDSRQLTFSECQPLQSPIRQLLTVQQPSIFLQQPRHQPSKMHRYGLWAKRSPIQKSRVAQVIDLQQPELYFQSKYGIRSSQLHPEPTTRDLPQRMPIYLPSQRVQRVPVYRG